MNNFDVFITRDAYVALKKLMTEELDSFRDWGYERKKHVFSQSDILTLGFRYSSKEGEVYIVELEFSNGMCDGFTGFSVSGESYSTQMVYDKISRDDDPNLVDYSKVMSQIDERMYVLNEVCSMSEGNRNFFVRQMVMWDLESFNKIKALVGFE